MSPATRCLWTELLALVFSTNVIYSENKKCYKLIIKSKSKNQFCIVCMLLQQSAVWLGALSEWMTSSPGRKLQVSVAAWLRLAAASHRVDN